MFDPTLTADATQTLALQTRKGGPIINFMNPIEPHDGIHLEVQRLRARYTKATHRNVGPSARYNCHGLTFAARRTGISDPAQIARILRDDGYEKLSFGTAPSPGDIAIYQEDGDIIHSGLVVELRGDTPRVLGKWGDCHEVIHDVRDCPYGTAAVAYYRLSR